MQASWLTDGRPAGIEEIRAEGIPSETLPLGRRLFQPRLDAYRLERGYIAQDEVALAPNTPGLEQTLARYAGEHRHDEDEVRFVLEGAGVFDIRSRDDRWLRVEVGPGDLIIVPRERYHRFSLGPDRRIRCVRLFHDRSGWTPHYREATAEASEAGTAR